MNKRIKGKLYNTESAKELARIDSGHSPSDFEYWEEVLYLTKSGNFFLYGWGGGNSRYGEWHGNSGGTGEKIMPMEIDEAVEWSENNLSGDEVEQIFGRLEEDKVKITADISVSAKERLDSLRKETGKSIGEIVEELLNEKK